MTNLIIRTEDIKPEHISELYVETSQDRKTVELLKSPTPIIIEGSRGTGKSFLLRVAEMQLSDSFASEHVLPVYVTFARSSLLQTNDPNQFTHWMMAKLCSRVMRCMYQRGLLVPANGALKILTGGNIGPDFGETPLESLAEKYEQSYRNPSATIDPSSIPTVDDFRDAIEDICRERGISRIAVFFDEAAHIFRPEQQRQFFTIFRDLRSPYLTCNAAVYPGVTFYGQTFQATHDATIVALNRDPVDPQYLDNMREIILKQADSELASNVEKNPLSFEALAYAVSGNPRLLLKTVQRSPRLLLTEVRGILKEFYRTEIWSEHTSLSERYSGHRAFIDWGREFIEKVIIPDALRKNELWALEGKKETTCYFWIHRDAPAAVAEALRLLSYTGIVTRLDSGIVATRRETGTRFAINLGCLAAATADPIQTLTTIWPGLSIKRFSEYGANYPVFGALTTVVGQFQEPDMSAALQRALAKSIDVLDLTEHQSSGLRSINIDTVGAALQASEMEFQRISYIGPKRSRRMMNVVVASVLEYLSG
ncbi:MAG: hypothetical protein LV481_14740 [Methylacidiphilales bacterium]|nr:hypothetical protein [Candidatus Methylacidiphilales bacterium]